MYSADSSPLTTATAANGGEERATRRMSVSASDRMLGSPVAAALITG